jgi:hypothetical protein
MARDKASRTTRSKMPVRLQDLTGLVEAILEMVATEITNTLETRTETLEAILQAVNGFTVQTDTLTLRRGRRAGVTVLEPRDGFVKTAIGAPVIISQALTTKSSDTDLVLMQFAGEVLSTRRMRVAWVSSAPAPKTVRVHYIIGT